MPFARTSTAALIGVDAHLVEVEADVSDGLPATILIGLPDSVLREARERVRAAVLNSGETWPVRKITIGLSPVNLPKRGGGFDLAIAVALLAADEALPLPVPEDMMFLAELGLDGRLRPVPGVLPAAAAAATSGMMTVVVAAENKAEAELAPGARVVGAEDLAQVMGWLRDGILPDPDPSSTPGLPTPGQPGPDFRDYPGTPQARLAAEICAAGGHSLSILGPPGAGKSALAERLAGILPDLGRIDALEVASLRSAADLLPGWISRPPFQRPRRMCSVPAMIGGGSPIQPGAASLAHRGILLLEDAPEFRRAVLDSLRQPIETGQVTVARAYAQATFPAKFQLVVTARPCPCGAADEGACGCTAVQRRRYLARLAGPVLERIDVKIRLDRADADEIRQRLRSAERSAVIARRVADARERSACRLEGTPWRHNAEIPGAELRRSYVSEPGAMRETEHAMERGRLSGRSADKVLRIAWTAADLAGRDRPGRDEVHTALQLFLGEEQS